jgi:hypothetical protein
MLWHFGSHISYLLFGHNFRQFHFHIFLFVFIVCDVICQILSVAGGELIGLG